jgi:23S rRNA (cytosine1962-C5)-methyltransferase
LSYKIIKLKPGREKSLINRHPWVFSGAVQKMPEAKSGEIVKIVGHKDDFLGYGFFSKKSQITCRIFEFQEKDSLIQDDFAYWKRKIDSAYELRKEQVIKKNTNTYRLLHAEGDFFPGLIIDVYNDTAVVLILIKGVENLIPHIVASMKDLGFNKIYLRNTGANKEIENLTFQSGWAGEEGEMNVEVVENGVRFKVNVVEGQKTGFFIDQRDNRELLGRLSKGKKILNTFCYTGGFSAYAIKEGASEVHSVDISAEAVRLCDENIQLNNPNSNHQSFVADCFDFLRKMKEQYDIIILDPPAFAKNAHAVNQAAKGYKDINLQAIKSIRSGGLIFTFSCSQHIDKDLFRKIVFGAAADARREVKIIYQMTQPPDHPVNIYHPEGEYLKGLVLKVE